MPKEISGYVKLQIKGGQANPAPPVVNHTDSTPAVEAVSILDIMVLASGDETATPILDVGIRSLLS